SASNSARPHSWWSCGVMPVIRLLRGHEVFDLALLAELRAQAGDGARQFVAVADCEDVAVRTQDVELLLRALQQHVAEDAVEVVEHQRVGMRAPAGLAAARAVDLDDRADRLQVGAV